MSKHKFSNRFQESVTGTWPFEKEYKEILSKPAPKEDFIRIIGSSDDDMFYHFQLYTPTQSGYFHIECPMGYIDVLWAFLEALCLGKDFASFLTEYEGPNALLCAKKVDEDNIRVTLICDAWLEEDVYKGHFVEKCWTDYKPHASVDVVVNKRHFIYTLYMALIDIFVDAWKYKAIKLEVGHTENAQVDSTIVSKYLGYVQSTDKDKKLEKSLSEGTAKDVEKLLKEGANPNAVLRSKNPFKRTILEQFWKGFFEYDCENTDWDDFLEKNKLLSDYGAMPRTTFYLFFNGRPYAEQIQSNGNSLKEQVRLKVFRMFFEKNVFMRRLFWNLVVDIACTGKTEWLTYEQIAEKGRWTYPPVYACHKRVEYCKHLARRCTSFK